MLGIDFVKYSLKIKKNQNVKIDASAMTLVH